MTVITKVYLTEDERHRAEELYGFLPETLRRYADKKKNAAARAATLGCYLAFSRTAEKFGAALGGLYYLESGKPVMKNGFVSFSNKKDLCVCALSDVPVGVDAEYITEKTPDISRFLNAEENAFLIRRPGGFFELWTRKEALLKLEGTGLSGNGKYSVFDTDYKFTTEYENGYVVTICTKKKPD